jgi:hypothetical protein
MKLCLSLLALALTLTGCASTTWSSADQAQWEKNWGSTKCGGSWQCGSVPENHKLGAAVVLEDA